MKNKIVDRFNVSQSQSKTSQIKENKNKNKYYDSFILQNVKFSHSKTRSKLPLQTNVKFQTGLEVNQKSFPQYAIQYKDKPYMPCFINRADKQEHNEMKIKKTQNYFFNCIANEQQAFKKEQQQQYIKSNIIRKSEIQKAKSQKKIEFQSPNKVIKNGQNLYQKQSNQRSIKRKYRLKDLRSQSIQQEDQVLYKPVPKNCVCQICKIQYEEDYFAHLKTDYHRNNLKKSSGDVYMQGLFQKIQADKKSFQQNEIHNQILNFQNNCKKMYRYVKKQIGKIQMKSRQQGQMYLQIQAQLFGLQI